MTVYHAQLAKTPVATVCDPIFFVENFVSQMLSQMTNRTLVFQIPAQVLVFRLGFLGPNTSSRLVCGSLGEVFHQVQYLKNTWHSPYILITLVYIDPLLTYLLDPFGICAIYFDLQVQGIFKISPSSEKGQRFVSFQGFQEESHRLHFSRSLRRHGDHVSGSTDKQMPPIKGV